VDLFKNIIDTVFQAFSDIANAVMSVWDSVKKQFNKVLNFFGIGSDEKEEAAAKEYDAAKKRERDFRGATAVGTNDKGDTFRSTRRELTANRGLVENVEEAEQAVKDKGFRVLKGDERKAFNKSLAENTSAKKKAYEDIKNAPKMADYMPDFSKIFTKIGESISGFVTGAVDWVKEQFGFTGEGMPSFSELVLGLITLPYNLIKTVIGKIAGFFGFDEVASQLEALDFKDIIKKVISSITDMVSSAIDYIIDKFKSAGTAIADIVPDMDSIKNFLKGVLRNILPVADASSSWFSIKNLVAKAIPDSVYEFAGIDPKTGSITDSAVGEVIVGAPTAIRNEEAAQSMQQTQNENTALQSQAAGSGKAPTMNSNSTVNNVSSSNTTVVRPQVMPSRQPNSPSDMIWNGGANTATQ
jgi:phage-related protein